MEVVHAADFVGFCHLFFKKFNSWQRSNLYSNLTQQYFLSELLGVAYTQIRNPDSNLSLLGRS